MKLNRRSFVLGTAALGSMPILGRSLDALAQTATSSLLIDGTMEVASFADYETYGDTSNMRWIASGNAPSISTANARAGTRSARVFLDRKASETSFRTEATTVGNQRELQYRRTYWWGFSIFVPADWQVSSTWEVLFQTHNNPQNWDIPLDFSPILELRIEGGSDQWRIRNRYVQKAEGSATEADLKTAFQVYAGSIKRGGWTDWVFEYRPDWRNQTDGGVGVTRIWRDGTSVVNYSGPNCVNEIKGSYIKWGCYKSQWKDRAYSDAVASRTYYYDNFRVARPDEGSYAMVAPGSTAEDKTPMPPTDVQVT